VRAAKKLTADQVLIAGRYGGEPLRRDLDRIPLWKEDEGHISISKLWGYHADHPYLPKLKDVSVLLGSVADGVASLAWADHGFAYADAYDDKAGRYLGLVAGKLIQVAEGRGLVVKPAVAAAQLEADAQPAEGHVEGGTDRGGSTNGQRTEGGVTTKAVMRRFHGHKRLDPLRPGRDFDAILKEIVQQLERAGGTVELTLDINASADEFDETIQRTATENANTLKLDSHEFES
jgi:hypothetical protein